MNDANVSGREKRTSRILNPDHLKQIFCPTHLLAFNSCTVEQFDISTNLRSKKWRETSLKEYLPFILSNASVIILVVHSTFEQIKTLTISTSTHYIVVRDNLKQIHLKNLSVIVWSINFPPTSYSCKTSFKQCNKQKSHTIFKYSMRFDVRLVIPIVFKKMIKWKKDENMFTYYQIYYRIHWMKRTHTQTNKQTQTQRTLESMKFYSIWYC